MRISAVIPAFNEQEALADSVRRTADALTSSGLEWEIVVVDDGSTDATWTRVLELASRHQELRALRFSRNFGKEMAIVAGMAESSGDAVVVLDADLQHPPELVTRMIERWQEGAVVVEAVKESRQPESGLRRLGSRLFYSGFRRATGIELTGATDFKLLDRTVVDAYLALPERNRFFRGLTRWLGYPAVALPFTPEGSPGRVSRWSLRQLTGLAWDSLTSFSVLPLRLIIGFGLVTFVVSIALGAVTLWQRFRGTSEPGFPTVILLQLGIGSILMISMGLLGEYLGRIYEELKRRPLYVVERRAGGSTPDDPGSEAADGTPLGARSHPGRPRGRGATRT